MTDSHKLQSSWCFYVHHSMDTDWSIESYRKIMEMKSVEDFILFFKEIPSSLFDHYMIFIMRDSIQPLWECTENEKGGCFSTKIEKGKIKQNVYRLLSSIIGETIIDDSSIRNKINGISISPKKNCCILKLWMCDNTMSKHIHLMQTIQEDRSKILYKQHHIETK